MRVHAHRYLVVQPSTSTLHDVRRALLDKQICAIFVKWRTFGTSGHRCRPSRGVLPSFSRRARTEDEVPHGPKGELSSEWYKAALYVPTMDLTEPRRVAAVYKIFPRSPVDLHRSPIDLP